jgi:DNA adenine methylase
MLDGRFGYNRTGSTSKVLSNKRANFTVDFAIRLQQVQIECCDALRIIKSRDTPETFFYLDPPYVGTDMGHYDGYTQMDFDALLTLLEGIHGKFLLSSFHNASIKDFTRRNGWYTVEYRPASAMTHGNGRTVRSKIEVLTANFHIKA